LSPKETFRCLFCFVKLLIELDPESILFAAAALNPVVKRIMRITSAAFGPTSGGDVIMFASSRACVDQILPFEVEIGGTTFGFEAKRAALVSQIVISFVREGLNIDVDLSTL
jgi:hypothetical protein